MRLRSIIAVATIFSMVSAFAAETIVDFGYAMNPGQTKVWGSKRVETYDVAILLKDERIVGKKVLEMSVPVVTSSAITDYSVWLSTELKIGINSGTTDKVNKPNVCSFPVTPQDGKITFKFEEPYTITESGVYVGYSFNVTELDGTSDYPLVLSQEINPDGFWLHSSMLFTRWQDRSEFAEGTVPMIVKLEGEFPDASLNMSSLESINVAVDKPIDVKGVVRNTCGKEISGFDYTYTVGQKQGEGTIEFDEPMPALYNGSREVAFTLDQTIEKVGDEDVSITITKVNGKENVDAAPTAVTTLYGVKIVPTKRVVVEEFTGTWCGNCVRGIAGMEEMKLRHPGDFIPVVLHNSDPMHMREGYIERKDGRLPGCLVDRVWDADPYFGDSSGSNLGIEKVWSRYKNQFTPLEINVKADFTDENRNVIEVETSVFWVKDPEDLDASNYRLEYVLTASDLCGTGSKWSQENWYSGDENCLGLVGMDYFVNAPSLIENFKYQDVMIWRTINGIVGSVDDVSQHHEGTYKFTIDTRDAVSIYGNKMVQDPGKLRVVVYMLHFTETGPIYGEIVNAAQTDDYVGVREIASAESQEEVSAQYYDLSGRIVSPATEGVVIKVSTMADGSRRSAKIVNNQ